MEEILALERPVAADPVMATPATTLVLPSSPTPLIPAIYLDLSMHQIARALQIIVLLFLPIVLCSNFCILTNNIITPPMFCPLPMLEIFRIILIIVDDTKYEYS